MLAANAPDIDGLALVVGRSLELRRGWTHGVVALALWPWVLAGAMVWFDRWRRKPNDPPARFVPLAAVSAIGVLSHPFLDYLNTYGLRWLMPFQDRWFYGDTLYIVDPWLLLMLGAGIWWSRRRERTGDLNPGAPARIGLAAASMYIGGMMASTLVARSLVLTEWSQTANPRIMVSAMPINPWRKEVVIDDGARYYRGRFDFLAKPRLTIDRIVDPGVGFRERYRAFAATRDGRAFFHWARFPVLTGKGGYDLRYATEAGQRFAAFQLTEPLAPR